ncbi:unnamed protein product [Kuraishia capsulata CBS 1993]|uniref:FYVE-type domain-containing protein n=1 Tax=Kuraishia capsulata CBS 1993 TaxID=1382522 RepID=W6MJV8_9ASCO|nr:uncharacterized protein KUCA_T00002798001 [Kuraishia capsulata CBS 1993]CDK26824.1 unnamed protein product [Kuraishia capsulata CBS 1993]
MIRDSKKTPTKRRVLGSSSSSSTPNPRRNIIDDPQVEGSDLNRLIPSLNEMTLAESTNSSSSVSSLSNEPASSIESVVSPNGETSLDMMCPICGEKMVTLMQLNRHLDDEHSDVEPVANEDDLKSWFRKKVIGKANEVINSNINPNKKFLKLDLFDNNFSFTESSSSVNLQEAAETAEIVPITIPRNHWKRPSPNEICNTPGCSKYLSVKNGQVNCRKCGKLFCNTHTYYRVKINAELEYDPKNGIWSRCCQACYLGKPGHNDTNGRVSDLSTSFKRLRTEFSGKRDLDVLMLERRWLRFYEYYRNLDQGIRASLPIKQFERSVVNWQSDSEVKSCRICQQRFSFGVLRKHHCRLCGLITCGDVATGCSMDVPLNILSDLLSIPSSFSVATASKKYEKLESTPDASLRMCLVCKNQLLSKRLFIRDMQSSPPEILSLYSSMVIYKTKIVKLLPELKITLELMKRADPATELSSGVHDHNATIAAFSQEHEMLQLATQQRLKLMRLFTRFDGITKRIGSQIRVSEELQAKGHPISIDELKIQKSIYQTSLLFLQENMLSLQSVPKILKGQSNDASISSSTQSPEPAQPKMTKREVRELRDQMMVLKEQRFLVADMVENSKKKRRFEDLKSLEDSLADLDKAIQDIDDKLGDESFT